MTPNLKDSYFSALELAGLPGMPATPQGVSLKAKREGWTCQSRQARGGGKEYHIDSLPIETREAIRNQPQNELVLVSQSDVEIPTILSFDRSENPVPSINAPSPISERTELSKETPSSHQKVAAIMQILQAFKPFCKMRNLKKCDCRAIFSLAYNEGQIPVDAWVKEAIPRLSSSSLARWEGSEAGELIPQYGNRKGKTKIDGHPEMVTVIEQKIAQGWMGYQIMEVLEVSFGQIDFDLRTLQRWIRDWKERNPQTAAIYKNPNRARGSYGSAIGSASHGINHPNQLWELDSTLADLMLADGKRYALVGGIDVFSRRCRFYVSPTSSGEAICSLLRLMCLDFGLPESVKTDNGKDYLSERLQVAISGFRVNGEITRHIKCQPRNPKQKPHIERMFGVLCNDLISRHPDFIGRNVEERQNIRARQELEGRGIRRDDPVEVGLNREEFQDLLDRWCVWYETQRPHGELGMTPLAKWHEGVRVAVPVAVSERQLDLLLSPAPKSKYGLGMRKVEKGTLEIGGYSYINADLIRWNGRVVHVRFDPLSISRIAVYEDENLYGFICVAECKHLLTQEQLQQQAMTANKIYKQVESAARRTMRQEDETGIEAIQAYRDANNSKVVHLFGNRTEPEEFESESLQEAQEALEMVMRMQPNQPEPSLEREVEKALPEPEVRQEVQIFDDEDFYRFWNQVKAGKPIPANVRDWMGRYLLTDQGMAILEWLQLDQDDVLERLATSEIAI